MNKNKKIGPTEFIPDFIGKDEETITKITPSDIIKTTACSKIKPNIE